MRIRDDLLSSNGNNFTLVRLVLASAVIYTHCYWIVSGVEGRDDLSGFLGAPISVYAVDGFFFLSGFLVYPSLLRFGGAGNFLLARLSRLWPALGVSVLATVIIGFYFSENRDISYLYGSTGSFIFGNLTFTVPSYSLTGVNCNNSLCNINGSLWTLPWEARCYVILAVLSILGLAKPSLMKAVVLPLTLIGVIAWSVPAVRDYFLLIVGSGIVFHLDMFVRLWPMFALGSAAWIFRRYLFLSWWLLIILLVVTVATSMSEWGVHLRALLIGYAVLCGGLLSARKSAISHEWPDYSYGMYIYAFPIMVALHGGWQTSSYILLAVANFALTLPIAIISWHFVEKPALESYRRWRRGRQPAITFG